jgi:hypothetical protein
MADLVPYRVRGQIAAVAIFKHGSDDLPRGNVQIHPHPSVISTKRTDPGKIAFGQL